MQKKVFQLLVDNTSGVLSRISGLFSRRGYNIESITAGVTADPRFTRITIVTSGDDQILEQIEKQVAKLIDIRDIKELKPDESVYRELALIKVRAKAQEIACEIVRRLPRMREILATDVEAAYNGDPAATSFGEIISCYPVIRTLTNYRLAHELHLLGVPLIPRMISELAHSETGIDIHPAAEIGHHFTIDHGTGVVIGATCIIGNNVKLYQGVTLGALSFPLDEDGNPIKGIPRHPILGNDVIVYSNATILGRITIGDRSVIGANRWVTDNIAPDTKIYKNVKMTRGFENGYGI